MGRFDTSIYKTNPLRSVADYEAEFDERDLKRQTIAANKFKLDEAQRGVEEKNALKAVYATLGDDPEANYNTLLTRAGGEAAAAYRKSIDDSKRAQAEVEAKQWAQRKEKLGMASSIMMQVAQDPSQVMSAIQALEDNGLIDFAKSRKLRQVAQSASPEDISKFAQQQAALTIDAYRLMPDVKTVDLKDRSVRQVTSPMTGRVTQTSTMAYGESPDNIADNKRMAADSAASRAVQWANLAENKRQFEARQQSHGGVALPKPPKDSRYTESGDIELIPGSASYLKAKDQFAKDDSALKQVETTADITIGQINEILDPKNRKGFNANFGGWNAVVGQFLPDMNDQTQNVRNKINSIKSGMKKAGLEMMRQGGSIGQMTVKEWPIVEGMIAAIDPTLGEKAAENEFNRVKAYLEGMKVRAKEAHNKEWGGSQFSKPAAQAPQQSPSNKPSVSNW